ncbi:MAG TPA: radical SAM protein [Acidobacteriota bacterium]
METLSYAEFSRRVHSQVVAERVPINGSIEVTRRCPLECAHCYNNLPMSDRAARKRELTLDEHRRILDQIGAAGCLWLLYSGGEIFARKDFLDIYTHAKRQGFIITLFTNGTLITPKIADHLAVWRPFAIEITLYGHTRETYERLTGIPGSHARCRRGIELLLERGLPLKLKTVAVSINRHEIWDMQRFAAGLGVEFKFDSLINPRIDCSQSPLAVRLQPEEVVELDLQDPTRVDEYRALAERVRAGAAAPPSDEVYHCGGGVHSFAIDPEGKLSICVLSHVDKYDLRQGSFADGWGSFLRKVRQKKISRPTKCVACRLKAICGMCAANGELENGDPEAPVDFLCQTAHLRAHTFRIPIAPHGDCEYCASGAGYQELLARLSKLRRAAADFSGAKPAGGAFLPLARPPAPMGAGCHSGGCSACGAAAAPAESAVQDRNLRVSADSAWSVPA